MPLAPLLYIKQFRQWLVKFIRQAIISVPVVRYALGIGGILAVVALIKTFGLDWKVAIIGVIIMLILMGVLLVLARASTTPERNLRGLIRLFLWSVTLIFLLTAILLVTASFFRWPQGLAYIVDPSKQEEISFQIVLTDHETSAPFDLDASHLLLRTDKSGDFPGKNLSDGRYQFEHVRMEQRGSDSGTLKLVGTDEWVFDNRLREKRIAIGKQPVLLDLRKDTQYLRIFGRIRGRGIPLPGVIVSVFMPDGSTQKDTTKSDGDFLIHLPANARELQYTAALQFAGKYHTDTVAPAKRNEFDTINFK